MLYIGLRESVECIIHDIKDIDSEAPMTILGMIGEWYIIKANRPLAKKYGGFDYNGNIFRSYKNDYQPDEFEEYNEFEMSEVFIPKQIQKLKNLYNDVFAEVIPHGWNQVS